MQLGDGADHVVPRRQRRRRRGRVEFIPRSTAIRQFQELFVGMDISVVGGDADGVAKVVLKSPDINGNDQSTTKVLPVVSSSTKCTGRFERKFTVEECSVLSTCARLNVILVLRSISPNDDAKQSTEIATRYAVAHTLHQQIQSSSKSAQERMNEITHIADQLTHLEGAHAISTHLCLVASGLMPRPDLSQTDVIFRPYSSRDAHVLMQLKRTVEIVSVQGSVQNKKWHNSKNYKSQKKATFGSPSRGRIKTLLDCALRAGKKARNESILPEIVKMKELCFDDDAVPPQDLSLPVIEVC